jgi:putative peptidoglycan lipid II flippase
MSAITTTFAIDRTNRGILSAAAIVTTAGVVVKLVATFKEFVVAGVYGRSDAMDAFLIAFLIPGLLINLISESMNQALVPTLVRVRETEGYPSSQQLLSSCLLWSCGLLLVVSASIGLSARVFFPLIASHFSPGKLALSVDLFCALLPVVVLTGIASNCAAVLNTLELFCVPAIAPIVTPLAVMVATWLLAARLGIWAIVYAMLAGAMIHVAWVASFMHRRAYSFRLRWHGWNQSTREVAGQFAPVLLSGIVASGGLLVDQSMAAMLPGGSVSALAYAGRFVGVVMTLLAGTVSSAVTPYFSAMAARREWGQCRTSLRFWTRLMALISLPIAVALIVGSRWLVRAAFQHGAFGAHDTGIVAPVLALYAIQIPFFAASRVAYRLILALRRTDIIFYCGLLNLALDIVLNLILMRTLGVAGIALATSLWSVSTFLFLSFWAHRLLRAKEGASL